MIKINLIFFLLIFSANVFGNNLKELKITFKPSNYHGENKISLSFYGKIYDKKNSKLFKILAKERNLSREEKKLIHIVNINKSGDKKEILMSWHPSERGKIKIKIENKLLFNKNLSFYKNINSSKLVAIMKYGKYFICFLNHDVKGIGSYIKVYPLLEDNGKLYLSNKLVEDFFYEKIAFTLADYFKSK